MDSDKDLFLSIHSSIDFHSIKDHPNILIAARFWEDERYCAAKTCYKFMRAIDDLIDNHKAANKMIAPGERTEFIANVNDWLKMVISSEDCNPLQKELSYFMEKFRIPVWPLEIFAKSMIYDINNDGFSTLDSFLDYSQGASVAPASIFVHLNGLIKKDGRFENPPFDVRQTATPCAIFSYLVHIIRDFQKDQLNNLSYFADDMLKKHGLSRHDLKEIALGLPPSYRFMKMIGDYYTLADNYRMETSEIIKKIQPYLEPRYQLSLEIIFELYLMVFEKIDLQNGKFTTEELNPSPEETSERVYQTILKFTC